MHTQVSTSIVILLGKGHETYQILALETIHFDERELVSEAIAACLKTTKSHKQLALALN